MQYVMSSLGGTLLLVLRLPRVACSVRPSIVILFYFFINAPCEATRYRAAAAVKRCVIEDRCKAKPSRRARVLPLHAD